MFKGHPKGLLAAALSNMGERFGYYIMNAVLVLFLCSKFGLGEGTAGTIYSFFYAGIYLLSLVGGLIADRTQNYKGTIKSGLIIMASGYVLLSIPILATAGNISWLLPLTCFALFMIAFGNGLFKGNQTIKSWYCSHEFTMHHIGNEAFADGRKRNHLQYGHKSISFGISQARLESAGSCGLAQSGAGGYSGAAAGLRCE